MDLNSILPLLLNKNGKGDKNDMIAPLLSGLMGKNGQNGDLQSQLISSMLGGKKGSGDISSALAKIMSEKNAPKARGFSPILGIVNNDILGKLTKYFS